MAEKTMIDRKSWAEFRNLGLLWWVNRTLHLLGWAIVVEEQEGVVISVYPARVKFRGFTAAVEAAGFVALSNHLAEHAAVLAAEAAER